MLKNYYFVTLNLFQGLSSPEETRFRTKFGMTSYFWDMTLSTSIHNYGNVFLV